MAVNAVRGMDVKVYIDNESQKVLLGGQRSCSISLSADELDITCKTSSATGFGDFLAGMKEGEISCDGLLVVGDESQTKLFDAFFAGSNLSVEVKNGTNVSEDDATVKYTATVVCTALDLNADYEGVMEYSATFKVKGDFVKVK